MTETRHKDTADLRLEAASGRNGGLLKGLVSGALIGAAAGVLFAPQIQAALRTLRRRATDAAADASGAAAERYREATARVGEAVDDLQQKRRGVYGKTLNAVVRGAEDIKARATEAQKELSTSGESATLPRR